MASAVAFALITIVAYFVYSNISGLLKNIAAAKRSGLPYVITPIRTFNTAWHITHVLFIPLLERLPSAWTKKWLDVNWPDWVWRKLLDPVKKNGDVFLSVHPGGIYVWATNAEVIHQFTSQREAFPKPLESYRILEIFGRNVITTEGGDWKRHRKVSSPGFSEKNNALVFAEACSQAEGMLLKWLGPGGVGNITLKEVPSDTLRLTLHIISSIGFGVQLLWPGETVGEKQSAEARLYSSNEPPEGHSMTFENSLEILLEQLVLVLSLPEWILKRLPFQKVREAYDAFVNWRQYMNEMFAQKVKEVRQGEKSQGMDIMGILVKSSYGAVLNEQLRLMPPIIVIPKSVTDSQDQVIVIDGQKYTLPAGARIAINTVGVQRNPRYWPTQPSKVTNQEDDLNDFRPERWLVTVDSNGEQQLDSTDSEGDDDFGGYTGNSSHAKLFHPVRGSYLPFSDGTRSCIGRRLAQVKIMAVLAVIFQKYSIELAVDEWASDAEVEQMSDEEKRVLYDGLKKVEIEAALDEYLKENSAQYSGEARLAPFYKTRGRGESSPVKKEFNSAGDDIESKVRPVRRRITKAAEELIATDDSEVEPATTRARSALTRTPRAGALSNLSFASSVPLPPSPSVVADAIDRRTAVLRSKVSQAYEESGIVETTQATRESLSTLVAIQTLIVAFELFNLRNEVLPNKYAFTIPEIPLLNTSEYPVKIPDLFLLLTSSFWGPTILWGFSSLIIPLFAAFFFNLTSKPRARNSQTSSFNYTFDPLTFNIVKALLTFVIYGQDVTFGGLVDLEYVTRINSALYGGWVGVLVGTGIGALVTVYEAVLKK
ncbi:hypothetical protein G7Y89_g13089 [Cudoniella acicularis]|uniref:Cytochrome P450 n=1 Tax=Cudoniella acicularis TaxID=354080 RepID=A0A8H4VYK5_9HELO|nr:hypothetical protein G7Y89_g13089 [Cudoniella acicularis]